MLNPAFLRILVIVLISLYGAQTLPLVGAQIQSATDATEVMNVMINDAIRSLRIDNTTKALQNLGVLDQMISEMKSNSSRLQAAKLLVDDAILALNSNDTARSILYLNLTGQQLNVQHTRNQTFLQDREIKDLLTYYNPLLGISIQYPSDWSIRQYEYNPAVNNTLVGFYSSSKTASELGNISGISGNFVPYLDIFVFGPQNISLNEIFKERLNTVNQSSNLINESKSIFLGGNQSAYSLVYTSTTQGEYFKKMQVYTSVNNKIYLISFTSQDALFSNYLDTVRKMVDSFKSTNSTAK